LACTDQLPVGPIRGAHAGERPEDVIDTSIVSGWLPVVVVVVAVACATTAVVVSRVPPRRLLVAAGVVATTAAVVALLLWTVGSAFPATTVWWSAAALWLLVVTVAAWPHVSAFRRAVSVVAVVLLAIVTLGSLNAAYGTYPALDRLVHLNPVNNVTAGELAAIERHAELRGKLPSRGTVVVEHIAPTVSGFRARDAYVYLPPAWFATPRPALPTLILLPGEPGSPADWTVAGDADTTADAFAAEHDGRAPIIVMPDPNGFLTEDTECVNSKFGNAETYLTVDVPAFARSELGAATGPGSLAIAGLSAGATCSTELALRHPDEFATFASFSGFAAPTYLDYGIPKTIEILFDGSRARFDEHDPLMLLRRHRYPGLDAWFEVGESDTVPHHALGLLVPAAQKAGIDTCSLVRPGGHDFALWSQAFADALPWLAWRLHLMADQPHVPATCTAGAS
jgi:S-formylglutathione hydrolase FrmB